ncbi:hypothetical protein H4S14_001865 [Agrobacterium vitis]|nr:hypothetical protein [Agrobacterium vitis]MBE1438120.1 hypothetical protein [Agrobacterium vitis]
MKLGLTAPYAVYGAQRFAAFVSFVFSENRIPLFLTNSKTDHMSEGVQIFFQQPNIEDIHLSNS